MVHSRVTVKTVAVDLGAARRYLGAIRDVATEGSESPDVRVLATALEVLARQLGTIERVLTAVRKLA